MGEATIQLPPDSSGTKLRTLTNPAVADGAHQEVVTLALEDGTLLTPATQTTLAAVLARLLEVLTVSGTVALDVPSLTALETVTVANPTETGLAKEATLGQVLTELGQKLEAGGSVSVANFPATQAVSGTVTATSPSKALALDYTGRTDTQPVYMGAAPPATADATAAWTVTRFTYEATTADARVIRSDTRSPIAWTSRTDPTLDGQPAW